MRVAIINLLIFLSLISGCASLTDMRIDGKELEKNENVARLATYNSTKFENNLLFDKWKVVITSIDGVKVNQLNVFVQLSPGIHVFEYTCDWNSDEKYTSQVTGQGSVTFTFEGGRTYRVKNIKIESIGYYNKKCVVNKLQDDKR